MKKMHLYFFCLAAALACGLDSLSAQSASIGSTQGSGGLNAPASQSVGIGRDAYGTPHVYARTDKGAYFGAGYVAAEDRFFQMSWRRLMYQGRTAEFFGPGTITLNNGQLEDRNIINDREMRVLGITRYAERVYPTLDPEMKRMLQAYADGVNAYINSPTAVFHPMFQTHGVPIEDWRPQDCLGVWYSFARHFSSKPYKGEAQIYYDFLALIAGGMSRQEAEDELTPFVVCNDSAAVVQQSDVPAATQQAMQDYATQHGLGGSSCATTGGGDAHFSHAWTVAGSHTNTGTAVLVGDPRIHVQAPDHLYEWGMQGETFQITGVGLPGSPNILIGHAMDVAWSVTALGMDQGDLLFFLPDEVGHPGQYLYDGVWVNYLVDETEDLLLKDPNGGPPTVSETIRYRETVWGPVVTQITQGVQGTDEFTAHMVPLFMDGVDSSRGFLDMARATDTRSLFGASAGWSFPSANIVMADSSGDIAYTVVGTYPVRNPAMVMPGFMASNASFSSNQWIDHLPNHLRPHVFDPAAGYLFSANHSPVGSWYPIPRPWNGRGDGLRSKRLRELFADQTAPMPTSEIFRMHTDGVNVAYRNFTELGLWLRDQQSSYTLSTDAVAALRHLEPWWAAGATMDNSHYATALAHEMSLMFRESNVGQPAEEFGGGEGGLILFFNAMFDKIEAQPPVDFTTEQADYINQVLEDSYADATTKIGPSSTWQAWYDANRLTYVIEMWKSLEGAPSLDPGNFVTAFLRVADIGTILSAPAQTFTQLIDLGDVDGGLSVKPTGNSEHAPNLTSQQSLWESVLFKGAPLTLQGLRDTGMASFIVITY